MEIKDMWNAKKYNQSLVDTVEDFSREHIYDEWWNEENE